VAKIIGSVACRIISGCVVMAGLATAIPAFAQVPTVTPTTYDFSGTVGTGAPAAAMTGTFTLEVGLPLFGGAAGLFPATVSINGQATSVGQTEYYLDTYDSLTDIVIDFGNGGDSIFFYFPLAADTSAVSTLGPLEYTGVDVYYDGLGGCDTFNAPCSTSGFTVALANAGTAVPEPGSVGPFATAVLMGIGYVGTRRRNAASSMT
jgi:hypothetical protein